MGKNTLGIAALICGTIGLTLVIYSLFFTRVITVKIFEAITIIISGVAIILGAIGIKKDEKLGMDIAGLKLGSTSILILTILMLLVD